MPIVVKMPEVAETIVEGTIARWLKREGDHVEQYEPLVEVITDKVNVEIPAPVAGVLAKILVQPNTTIPVGAELAHIQEEVGMGAPLSTDGGQPAATAPASPVGAPLAAPPPSVAASNAPSPAPAGEPRLSPLVRRLAEQHGVDVSHIKGTGFGGRVRKQDILAFVAHGAPAPSPFAERGSEPALSLSKGGEAPRAAPPPSVAPVTGDVEAPLTPVRATIARRMVQSSQEIPLAWATFQVDVTGLVALREGAKDRFLQTEGAPLTYLPFFIKAVVGALKEHPALNAHWASDRIILKKDITIGVAVDREEGLIVPVVRQAEQKSIAALARELHQLIERARLSKLAIQDVQGATFTVNNTGAFGAIMSQPIVNPPQVAILAAEAIVKQPMVVGDRIEARSVMHISISFDHRALDGGVVGRFMQTVKRKLEAYGPDSAIY